MHDGVGASAEGKNPNVAFGIPHNALPTRTAPQEVASLAFATRSSLPLTAVRRSLSKYSRALVRSCQIRLRRGIRNAFLIATIVTTMSEGSDISAFGPAPPRHDRRDYG